MNSSSNGKKDHELIEDLDPPDTWEEEGEEDEDDKDDEGEEDGELEAEFRKTYNEVGPHIEALLKDAMSLLDAAVELSEKHGIPFEANISPLSQSYTPTSYEKKFAGLSQDFVVDLTDAYPGGEYGGDGWEHSAVC